MAGEQVSMQQRAQSPLWARVLRSVIRALGMGWQRLVCWLSNRRRRLLRGRIPDYVVFVFNQSIEERTPAQPWWYSFIPGMKTPLSLAELERNLRRIAGDPDVKGVLFLFKNFPLSMAQAQSLAALFGRFRTWSQDANPAAGELGAKEVVVHLEQISRTAYVAACAADRVFITPQSTWDVVGLYTTPTFFKETLALAGVKMDVVKIAPWKTAFDAFSQSTMTAEYEAQTQWLFDSVYADLVSAIQQGRKLDATTVQSLIDGAPWSAQQAHANGLVDGLAYEDELPRLLGDQQQAAKLKHYRDIRRLLLRRLQARQPQRIGVISLTGAIIPGSSRSFPIPLPLLGENVLGHLTAQQQIRAAREDQRLAAVIVHIDSRGGSALASDLIWRELKLLNDEKPVVAYMGDVAASGGYYIALPTREIVAQRATLTGSIGVITAKPVLRDAYAKLQARRYAIQRGEHAGLYSEDEPWNEDQRAKVEEGVRHSYAEFKERVAQGRNLPYDQLDAICNGRVWTGVQALEHGLVDALGDFSVAVERACALADLPSDGSVALIDLSPGKDRRLAEPVQAIQQALGLAPAGELTRLAYTALSGEWAALLQRERFWWIAEECTPIE